MSNRSQMELTKSLFEAFDDVRWLRWIYWGQVKLVDLNSIQSRNVFSTPSYDMCLEVEILTYYWAGLNDFVRLLKIVPQFSKLKTHLLRGVGVGSVRCSTLHIRSMNLHIFILFSYVFACNMPQVIYMPAESLLTVGCVDCNWQNNLSILVL